MKKLSVTDHSRDFQGLTYIYPVLSRRIGGISLGVNLNINNACNWQCVYCQVPNLIRGAPVAINLDQLENELDEMLNKLLVKEYQLHLGLSDANSELKDIAISGNGEPTLSTSFPDVVDIIAKLKEKYAITSSVKTTLITNGSQFNNVKVLNALSKLAAQNAQVWFKVDAIDNQDIKLINQVDLNARSIGINLYNSSQACPTYIQTCIFKLNDLNPSQDFINKYVEFVVNHQSYIQGVLLYSTARIARQGFKVDSVAESVLVAIATKLQHYGIKANYYV